MTTAQSRSGRHALNPDDQPVPHGDEVDPTAATAAFAAVPRTAAVVPPPAPYPTPYGPPHAGHPYPAASHPSSYPPPGAVPAQRTAVDGTVPPPPAGHWPSRAERPAPAPRRRRVWPFVVAGVLLLLLIVGIAGATGSTTPATTAAPAPVPVPAAQVPAAQVPAAQVPAAAAPVAPVAPAEPAGPATTVDDGRYEVGVDMAAGKYKTTGPGTDSITGMCYQARSKDDSGELGSIISNDLVQGPSVMTVKDGEVVDLSGGCSWTKQ